MSQLTPPTFRFSTVPLSRSNLIGEAITSQSNSLTIPATVGDNNNFHYLVFHSKMIFNVNVLNVTIALLVVRNCATLVLIQRISSL